nr:AtpZ/AtpI family protein [uncultured Arsenicibacter sp.]
MENKEQKPGQEEVRKKLDDASRKTSSYAQYSSIAFQMLGTIGLGVWGGMKIDEWLGNKFPAWTVILSLTAIGASLYLFIKQLPKQ